MFKHAIWTNCIGFIFSIYFIPIYALNLQNIPFTSTMPHAISDATEQTPKNFLQYVGTFKLNREMHVPADSAVNPWHGKDL